MVQSVLVVCSGNVCRSPTGERLLRHACPDLRVDSAGTMAMAGHCADSLAQSVAEARGITLSGHVARQLTTKMIGEYDLLLVMELAHLRYVMAIAPWARGKTLLFGLWDDLKTVPDPYRQGRDAFENVFGLLEQASRQWALRLTQ